MRQTLVLVQSEKKRHSLAGMKIGDHKDWCTLPSDFRLITLQEKWQSLLHSSLHKMSKRSKDLDYSAQLTSGTHRIFRRVIEQPFPSSYNDLVPAAVFSTETAHVIEVPHDLRSAVSYRFLGFNFNIAQMFYGNWLIIPEDLSFR